jgi:hypothetical protein
MSNAVVTHSSTNMLLDGPAFEHGQRVAKLFASSQLVPPHLRDKVADCFIALHMAQRLNEDPLIVLQNIYIVSGRAGWSAQYMIGRANRSGVFKGRINWRIEGKGENLVVTAFAHLDETGEEVSAAASMVMAKAEGWTKNSKYQSMPEVMLRYRSATMLIRFYCPEVMLGIPAADEIEDQVAAGTMRDITPARGVPAEAMDAFEAAAAGLHSKPAVTDVEEEKAAAPAEPATQPEPPQQPQPALQQTQPQSEPAPYEFIDATGEALPYDDPADAAKAYSAAIDGAKYIRDKAAVYERNKKLVADLEADGFPDLWRPAP